MLVVLFVAAANLTPAAPIFALAAALSQRLYSTISS